MRIAEIEAEQQKPDFWKEAERAQRLTREMASRQEEVNFMTRLTQQLASVSELIELATAEKDAATLGDAEEELQAIEQQIILKEKELRFNGPHDRAGAIVTIQAGAGGTDAADWAEMLERMYLRAAEQRGWRTRLLDRSAGEEAGIKHSTFSVEGNYVYGILRGEHGVHRLVRLSPYNADNLRQTSFARVEVVPQLSATELPEINPVDLKIDTFRAGGAGGQHVNKTSSAVRITHVPTGMVVKSQQERSQAQNKAVALGILQAKLQALAEEQRVAEISELRGIVKQAAWGNQIRSYVLHPYTMVKDHRTKVEVTDAAAVLDGDLAAFL